jgi:hypothetical protein
MTYKPPSHWEAAFAFILLICIGAVAYSIFSRVQSSETVCFQFQTVEQMGRLRQ